MPGVVLAFPISSADVGKVGGLHVNNDEEEKTFQKAGKESVRKLLYMEMGMTVHQPSIKLLGIKRKSTSELV